jgi:RHS repeat-associated protein
VYSKTSKETSHEYYLYDNEEEIGAYTQKGLTELRILASFSTKDLPKTIAIELSGKPYLPILDLHQNIRHIIDPLSHTNVQAYDYTTFGQTRSTPEKTRLFNPWRYASKRLDPELGLIYFGKRYYDPQLLRWITTDPVGFTTGINLYSYLLNNPFRYKDPDGQFVFAIPILIWGAEVILPSLTTCAIAVGAAAVAGVATWAVCEYIDSHRNSDVAKTINDILDNTVYNTDTTQDTSQGKKKGRNTNPFDKPVDEDVFIGDDKGNIIPVPEGHQVGGSKDGKWIQVKDEKGKQTGARLDGSGHKEGPKHPEGSAGLKPHGHVPGITNPDGTDQLPIH